jgi:serine kinase of HPr protein (carbohydrate metabolism regulator)
MNRVTNHILGTKFFDARTLKTEDFQDFYFSQTLAVNTIVGKSLSVRHHILTCTNKYTVNILGTSTEFNDLQTAINFYNSKSLNT